LNGTNPTRIAPREKTSGLTLDAGSFFFGPPATPPKAVQGIEEPSPFRVGWHFPHHVLAHPRFRLWAGLNPMRPTMTHGHSVQAGFLRSKPHTVERESPARRDSKPCPGLTAAPQTDRATDIRNSLHLIGPHCQGSSRSRVGSNRTPSGWVQSGPSLHATIASEPTYGYPLPALLLGVRDGREWIGTEPVYLHGKWYYPEPGSYKSEAMRVLSHATLT